MIRVALALIATGLSFVIGSVGLILLVSSDLRGDLNAQYEMFGGGAFGSAFFVVVGLVHVVIAIDLMIPGWRRIGAVGAALLMGSALVFTLAMQTSPKPVSNLLNLRLVAAEIGAEARVDYEICLRRNPDAGGDVCQPPAVVAETARVAYEECLSENPTAGESTCGAPPSDPLTTRLLVWVRDVVAYRPPDAIGYRVVNESILNAVVGFAGLVLLRGVAVSGRSAESPSGEVLNA